VVIRAFQPSTAPGKAPLTPHAVLAALVGGFALVMFFLGAAGWQAVREGRHIRDSVKELVRERLLITRLLEEAQVEEDAIALALHRFTRTEEPAQRIEALEALNQADQAVARLAEDARATPQATEWAALAGATREFTREIRATLESRATTGPLPPGPMDAVFNRHETVVRLIHDLIRESSRHLLRVDQRLDAQLRDLAQESALLLGTSFALAIGCAAGTVAFVRAGILRIEAQADELNQVSRHMLRSQEETARRFSHELHDELGQSLAALRANLLARPHPDDSLALVDVAIANVRELSQLLRPVILDDFGLEAGLRWLTEGFGQRTGIEAVFIGSPGERPSAHLETHLFRIAQEALTNVARHSGATRVEVSLERDRQTLRLRITDNGRGLPAPSDARRHSLGLVGMRARARECGGSLAIDASPGTGCTVTVSVPFLPADPEESPEEA
jgi:signal transduction histidine kinase